MEISVSLILFLFSFGGLSCPDQLWDNQKEKLLCFWSSHSLTRFLLFARERKSARNYYAYGWIYIKNVFSFPSATFMHGKRLGWGWGAWWYISKRVYYANGSWSWYDGAMLVLVPTSGRKHCHCATTTPPQYQHEMNTHKYYLEVMEFVVDDLIWSWSWLRPSHTQAGKQQHQ